MVYSLLGPIKDEYLTKILEYLFPDSKPNSDHEYPTDFERSQSLEGVSTIGVKSAPVDGLVWRLTVVLAHCLHVLGESAKHVESFTNLEALSNYFCLLKASLS